MAHSPQYQLFVDDELDRAPMLIDQVLQTVEEQAGRGAPPRALDGAPPSDLRQVLTQQRGALIRRFCQSLREQVTASRPGQESASRGAPRQALSLVDESEVAADVELSRTVEAIASVAEYELRELRAYTSALVGDVNVSRETNPFRPEVYARALWTAASPLPQGHAVALMRQAAMPLAQALRVAYAAATTRLEDAGVEPGAYRTIILPAGSRTARRDGSPAVDEAVPSDLHELRDSMPVPLDGAPPANAPSLEEALRRADEMIRLLPDEAGLATRSQVLESQRMRLLNSAGTRVDQQLIELLTRLFDAILTDRALAPQVQVLLSRLHACVLRVALRDAGMLDSFDHPVWQFIDHVAFASELHPRDDDPLREKLHAYTQSLIDNLVRESVPDAALFRWALDRLKALDRHLYEQRRQHAQPQIDALQREALATETRPLPITPADTPIDIASLDTVPAELLDHRDTVARAAIASPIWLASHQPGDWVRLFLDGHWQIAQLLWRSESATVWLYAEAHEGITWALRRPAVELLHREGLLNPLRPHSLIERAAESVLRQVGRQDAR